MTTHYKPRRSGHPVVGLVATMTLSFSHATLAGDPYLEQLAAEADTSTVAATSNVTTTNRDDATSIRAARLGVTTPVGRKALETELRSYYPRAYRNYRALPREQAAELWQLYDDSGSVVRVLEAMDTLGQP